MKDLYTYNSDFISDIRQIIEQVRKQTYASINTMMLKSYWLVGRRIVEEEQGGESRAKYGKYLLKKTCRRIGADIWQHLFGAPSARLSTVLFVFQRYRDLALANAKSHLDSLSRTFNSK